MSHRISVAATFNLFNTNGRPMSIVLRLSSISSAVASEVLDATVQAVQTSRIIHTAAATSALTIAYEVHAHVDSVNEMYQAMEGVVTLLATLKDFIDRVSEVRLLPL